MTKFEIVWKALNGPKLIPEYKFHPTRRWRIDWWHESGVAVEIEGSIWRQGRHNRGSGFMADMEKYNALSERGILLFRIPAHQITVKWIYPIIETINRGGSLAYLQLLKEIKNVSA